MSEAEPSESGLSESSLDQTWLASVREVIKVALPLMISAGTFSLVLFCDRTLLLWYDGSSMSASMAGGNIFWLITCFPVGALSMTSAIIGQYVGSGERHRIGRFLWQAVWLSLAFIPLFALGAFNAEKLFELTGQPESLIEQESTYLRWLMIGAVGLVLESALGGFFSGIEKTRVIMWTALGSGLLNLLLDVVLIFGFGPIPAMGIAGAAVGTVISFWFKVVAYVVLLSSKEHESVYRFRSQFSFDYGLLRKLWFFGFPTGLMYLIESAGFSVILLRIGTLGDVPLRATTMAINFNMIAFIPLVGFSIAVSVLVGKHLLQSGAAQATRSAMAALALSLAYSGLWLVGYLLIPDVMISLYEIGGASENDPASVEAMKIAEGLLWFVAIYFVLDTVQLMLGAALRGAGDTWFVMGVGLTASATAVITGLAGEPAEQRLHWWWTMLAVWIGLLALMMTLRFWQGRWKTMRMV